MKLLVALAKFVFGIVQGLLWIRFVLKLLGAGETAKIVAWLYDITSMILAPLSGIFPDWVFGGRFTVEFTTLFAILVIAVIEFVVVRVLRVFASD